MVTRQRIAALAAAGESETLECKLNTGTRREAARTLCAMLNQGGGCVLFGIAPDGRVVGQQVNEGTIEKLSAELQRITPQAFPSIERVPAAGGREIIAVAVDAGPARPYSYRGVAYRRVGNTTLTLSADAYQRMLLERMHSEQRWENQPAGGWSVDELDAAEIRRTVTAALSHGRLGDPGASQAPADLLRGLGLFRDGALCRAAVALFGRAERLEFEMPQCLLRVARFRGTDRTEFLDNRQFHGHAFALLAHAERFLRETLPIAGRFTPDRLERIDEPLYPPLATREALANALCHRDYAVGGGSVGVAVYDDRLEITSTGALPFGLTPEILFTAHESRPWNPLIARTFFRRGLIEEWGRGTLKMAELTAAAGLPRPEIKDEGGCVTVCFRRAQQMPSAPDGNDLAARQKVILALLTHAPEGLALRELHAQLASDASERQIRRALTTLRARGVIASDGRGRAARWKLKSA